MKRFLIALQFLTIIPVKRNIAIGEQDLPGSASFFVFIGIIQGALLILSDLALGSIFHPDLSIALVLTVLVITNGGFHLDALADTFDGLAVRGDRERKLTVMKDSSVGAIGVIAIILSLALKYLALKNISHLLPFTYYSSLMLMPVISKWAMVIALFHGKPARTQGLGSLFIGRLGVLELAATLFTLFALFALLSLAPGVYAPQGQYVFYALILAFIYALSRLLIAFYSRQFGGLTGDTVGSIGEISEVIFLMLVIIWSRLYI